MSSPLSLGRYPVRRRLGAGAFATVWLARDEQLDSDVAIKVLADNWAGDDHVRRRFVEEGRFLRKVESPHVVPVYDAGELPDGRPYLVMAFADQGTLAERLALAPLGRAEALQVLAEVGAGLQALHERGVLHRDVKPGNVLLRSHDGRVRAMLADLGLGKELDMSSRLTVIAGTPSFVAPEQARGEGLDARADEFSLAALAYRLLAGRPVWAHESLQAAADPPPVPPMGDEAGVPARVEQVVRRGLAADREQRFDSVAAFAAALAEAAESADERAEPATVWQPTPEPDATRQQPAQPAPTGSGGRRGTLLAATAAAAAVVAVGVTGGWFAGGLLDREVRLTDDAGRISVTVPRDWTDSVQDGWTPPDGERELPALATGTGPGWREEGQGVFAGLLVGDLPDELPEELPGHPACDVQGEPVADGDSVTVVHGGCPGGAAVVAERVVRVDGDQLLWVQVRSADRATADRVLSGVEVSNG